MMKSPAAPVRRFIEILGLALVVLLTGRLGLLLALPPGYASPIWPPAGFALAGVLIFGGRVWPGVWLGSFALNLATAPDFSSAMTAGRTLAVPAAIAAGSTLQALAGNFLLRRLGGWPHGFSRAGEVTRFLALGGPVACVVAPAVGVTSLALAGLIPANYFFNWATWWSGDVLGVFIFAPLLALWARRGRSGRLLAVGLPMAVVCALAVLLFAGIARWERDRVARDFSRRSAELIHQLEKSVQGDLEVLHATAAFIENSRAVDRSEFKRFAATALARHPELERLSWIPRVVEGERAAFEAAVQAEGFAGFEITEPAGRRTQKRAGARREYAPRLFIEPASAAEKIMGLDVTAEPLRAEAVDRARAARAPAASAWVELRGADGIGLLVVMPVFHENAGATPAEPKGYVGATLHVARMIDAALDEAGTAMEITVRDGGDVQYNLPSRTFGAAGQAEKALKERLELPRTSGTLEFAGQRWGLDFVMTPEAWATRRTWEPWGAMAGMLVFAAALGGLLLVVTGREVALRDEIARRRRVEEELRESEAKFFDLYHQAPDMFASVDPQSGRILECNETLCRKTGFSRQEIRDRSVLEMYHPASRPAGRMAFETFVATGEVRDVELVLLRKDGSSLDVSLNVMAHRAANGKILHSRSSWRDITVRKQVEAELRRVRRQTHAELERQVAERTAELQESIAVRTLAEEQLQASLGEKEVLLQEVHHRVKNNLQVISSLLRLQSASLRDPETLALFQESQQRVHSMAMVHEKLYRSPSLAEIDFADYLGSLAQMLFGSYAVDRSRIRLESRIAPIGIDLERAIPLALIANELIANSLKYAFPGARTGVVTLEFGAADEGELRLAVCDDGAGLPGDFDLEQGQSLGLRIVNILTRQLHGRVSWRNGAGASFIIHFPSQPKRRPIPHTAAVNH